VVCYGYGEQTDYWPVTDLEQVLTYGGQVKVHRSFRAFDRRPVFHDWWHDLIMPARESLSGDARLAAKMLANRLWSGCAVGGVQKVSRWTDGSRRRIIERRTEISGLRYESYIAAEVTA